MRQKLRTRGSKRKEEDTTERTRGKKRRVGRGKREKMCTS